MCDENKEKKRLLHKKNFNERRAELWVTGSSLMKVYYPEKQAYWMGKDGSLGMVTQMSTIKLTMAAGTQEWRADFFHCQFIDKKVLGL